MNQKQNGGQWYPLGTFTLAPSQGHKITLSDNANGIVIADAIRSHETRTQTSVEQQIASLPTALAGPCVVSRMTLMWRLSRD